MWKLFVTLVRLPVAIFGAISLTFILPIGIIISIGIVLLMLLAFPFLFIRALFENDPKDLKNYGDELMKSSPIEVFRLYFELLGNLIDWTFLLDEH